MTSTGVKFTQPYCAGFHIPQLAPVATDPTFSFTPANFPFLVRLSPSDTIQCQALAGLITHYNWTQIALLTSKDDYGLWLFLSLSCFKFVYNFSRQFLLHHNSGRWGVKSTLSEPAQTVRLRDVFALERRLILPHISSNVNCCLNLFSWVPNNTSSPIISRYKWPVSFERHRQSERMENHCQRTFRSRH